MTATRRVLFHVEDPGAANFVALLPEALARLGCLSTLVASEAALASLRQRGLAPRVAGPEVDVLLDEERPSLVVVGTSENPRSLDLKLIDRARARSLPTVGAVDALCNADRRFRGDGDSAFAHAPDYLLVADAETRGAYHKLGYAAERIAVCGHPHYDHVRARRTLMDEKNVRAVLRDRLIPGAAGKIALVFVSEPVATSILSGKDSFRDESYTLAGRGGSGNRTAIVMEELLEAVRPWRHRIVLVARAHPRERDGEFAALYREFDLVSRGGEALEILHASDLVVGITSMALTEAALLGRPTLAILPRLAERMDLAVLRSGLVPSVSTRIALRDALENLLATPVRPSAPALEALLPSGATENAARFLAGLSCLTSGG